MSTKSKTLAKSLHTVTAIAAVARLIARTNPAHSTNEAAVAAALIVLGYADASDPYGLAARALASL